jgi:hypothetical protein
LLVAVVCGAILAWQSGLRLPLRKHPQPRVS